jgi:hypothetical protein
MSAPNIESPARVRRSIEHLVDERQRADVAARRQRPVHDADAAVADTANGAGRLLQERRIFGGIGAAAPFQVQIRLIPNLDVECKTVASRQSRHHTAKGLRGAAVVAGPIRLRFDPVRTVVRALQAQQDIQAAIISGIDIINPARIWSAGIVGNAIEELLGQCVIPHQFARAIELPRDVANVAVFLDEGVDAIETVAAPRRRRQPIPTEAAAADAGVCGANQDAIAIDARRARAVAEASRQVICHAYIVGSHVAGITQRDAVGHGAPWRC